MATTFTDKKGRSWDVALDLRKARIIDKSDFTEYWDKKFSILDLDKQLIHKLIQDAPFLFALIWAMVQDQAETKHAAHLAAKIAWERSAKLCPVQGAAHLPDEPFFSPPDGFPISPKETEAAELEFVSGVNGPTIELARDAFMEAISDFFPEQRTVLSILTRQVKSLSQKVGKKLEEAEPLLNGLLDEQLDLSVAKLKEEYQRILDPKLGEESSAPQAMPVVSV